jgi:hypothetical protein
VYAFLTAGSVTQAAPAAWTTMDRLLRTDGLPEEGYFFAANSLRAKIRR